MSQPSVSAKQRAGYRADIQGMRAIAVLLVVAFHVGLPVVGGFVGVDMFFVISGYVITSMLLREWHSTGTISLGRFWRRRFFRLTPALALTVFVVFILAALILLPLQQQVAYQTGLGAIFLVANIVIARNTGGYFDAPAEQNPLLNTWSLSVEEQFYLLFPLILAAALVLMRRDSRLSWLPTAGVIAVATISMGFMFWALSPAGVGTTWLNFYSPITRSWEFAIGSLLATLTWGRRPVGQRLGVLLRVVGGAGLIVAAFAIDASTPFPSQWTLIPVLATASLLLGGATCSNVNRRLLENSALVRVGDWSYSIYLWHWPFIVFAIVLGLEAPAWLLVVALLSFIPAVLSYRLVETPLRHWAPAKPRKRVAAALAIIGAPVLIVPLLVSIATPSPRFEGTVGTEYLETIWATSVPCDLDQDPADGSRCFQSRSDQPLSVVVVGDSHAEDLYLGLQRSLPNATVGYAYLPDWPYRASANAQSTFRQIADSSTIETVVVNARWDEGGASSDEVAHEVQVLADSNKSVFLADDRPTFTFHAERCQYKPWIGLRTQCQESSERFLANYAEYRPTLERIAGSFDNVHILNTASGICDSRSCSMTTGGDLLYADAGHFNEIGSQWVIQQRLAQDPVFREALRGK